MKISIFYKFFAIIFATFIIFEYINIKSDYETTLSYRMNLLMEEDESQTIKALSEYAYTKDKTIEDMIDQFNQMFKHEDYCFHLLVKDEPLSMDDQLLDDVDFASETNVILASNYEYQFDYDEYENEDVSLEEYLSVVPTNEPSSNVYIALEVDGEKKYYDLSLLTQSEIRRLGSSFISMSGLYIQYKKDNNKVVSFDFDGFKYPKDDGCSYDEQNVMDYCPQVPGIIKRIKVLELKTPFFSYRLNGVKGTAFDVLAVDHYTIRYACIDYMNQYLNVDKDYNTSVTQYIPYENGYILMNKSYIGSEIDHSFIENQIEVLDYRINEVQRREINQNDYYVFSFYYMDSLTIANQIQHEINSIKMPIYIALFLLSFIASLLLSKMLTRHIKDISEATNKITQFDFDIKLKEYSYDEIGILSANINQMSLTLKETISNLNNEIQQVKHLEGLRKEFIANFTHEIKTPLAIINGYMELLEDIEDETKKNKYLEAINKETEHINQLVMSMLDLSRLEAGKTKLHKNIVDVEDILSEIIDSYLPLLKKKEIMLHMNIDESIVVADEKEIGKVFRNFLSNAIQHTPQKGQIFISLENHIFSIENEGEPLSEADQEVVFETYVSSDREGTGLGLAICKAILELHQFRYGVENTQKGVKFYFEA